jgi:hypothetical protein
MKITLSRLLTHKYVPAYSYLDDSEEIGTARQIFTRQSRNDGESYRTFSLFMISHPDKQAVIDGFYDTLRSGCSCQHDCCGHYQTSVFKVRPLKGNLYAVVTSSYRNI